MYKAVLIDDEPWVLLGLENGIDWAEHGIEVCYKSTDSNKALDAIIEMKPDIVITDIHMPKLSGLDLIHSVREHGVSCKFVIFSGYSEFEYAKRAIQYGVFAYLLKPLDNEELSSTLKLLCKSLDEQQASDIVAWDKQLDDEIDDVKVNGVSCALTCYMTASDKLLLDRDLEKFAFYSKKLGSDKYLYLFSHDNVTVARSLEKIFSVSEHRYKDYIYCGLSEDFKSKEKLSEAVRESNVSALAHFLNPGKIIHLPQQANESKCAEYVKSFAASLEKSSQEAELTLRDLPAFCMKNSLNVKDFCQIYNNLLDALEKYSGMETGVISEHINYNRLVALFPSGPQEAVDFLISLLHESNETKTDDSKKEPFEQILSFIRDNYSKEITLSELSERFYLNMTYICDLFKKNLETTFSKYLNNLRLESAHDLIVGTDNSLMDIAERVGYRDYYYFIKQFKRKYEITPGQLRKSNK